MDKTQLHDVLHKMDQHLQKNTSLHIRGGSACILHGEEYRATIDIDIIPQQSRFEKEDLRQACKKAGVLLDPTSFEDMESGKPYIQLLPEESLILPRPKPNAHMTPWKRNKLAVTTPPPADMIISKLKRCDAIDIQDIAFLMLKFEVNANQLKEAFNRLDDHWKSDIILKDNFENTLRDFFDVFEEKTPCKKSPQKKQKTPTMPILEPEYI